MSIASQQRVIEEHQATIRRLREELTQAKVDRRDAVSVFEELTALCDEYEVNRLDVIPVALLRHIRPRSHGVQGGQPLRKPTNEEEI